MNRDFRIKRLLACAAMGIVAVVVMAAAPQGKLDDLDEIVITARAPLKPDDFVELPKFDSVTISPSGKRLAVGWVDTNTSARACTIYEFPSMKLVINYAMPGNLGTSTVSWASERRLMIEGNFPLRGVVRAWEPLGMLRFTDPDGGKPHNINGEALTTQDPLVQGRREEESVAEAASNAKPPGEKLATRNSMGPVRLVTTHTDKPDQILFQTVRANDRGGNTDSSGAFLLNLKDNRQTRVATLPLTGGQFVTGPGHQVALVTGINSRNETVVYYLPENVRAGGKDWQLVVKSPAGQRGLRPVAWTGNGEEYYALDGRGTPTRAVVIWNAATNTTRLLYRHEGADMDNVALDPNDTPWMFYGADHFPVYWYPNPEHPLAKLHRAVASKARDEFVEIHSASDDMTSSVVRVSSGRRPPVYLPVNTGSASSMAPALFSYPTLRGSRLAQVDPIEFRARDGLFIRGYLTNPVDGNGKPRTGLPLVLIAHDGPLDEPAGPGYELERQLFASRGYAVLQINHRGSRGHGVQYERAGDGKWGREVQNDYADGVAWAIKDGVADAKRVCFYGVGFGAFSAMITAAREPEMFKCVIGVGGVYDLPRYLGDGDKQIPAALQQVLGNDMKDLLIRSPVNLAPFIKSNVYLLPQEKDEYFPMEQSMRMRAALKDAGNNAQWEPLGVERDGYHSSTTRAYAYEKIFRFLEQNIGK